MIVDNSQLKETINPGSYVPPFLNLTFGTRGDRVCFATSELACAFLQHDDDGFCVIAVSSPGDKEFGLYVPMHDPAHVRGIVEGLTKIADMLDAHLLAEAAEAPTN